jgi:hypothetical protein
MSGSAGIKVVGNDHGPRDGAAHHDRAWWRIEARRLGTDWRGVLRLHAEAVATWRASHDPDYGRAAA